MSHFVVTQSAGFELYKPRQAPKTQDFNNLSPKIVSTLSYDTKDN